VLSIASMFRSLVLAGLAPLLGYSTDQWGLAESFAIGGALAAVGAILFGLPLAIRAARGFGSNEPAGEAAAAG
jgi:hypothetical protein